MPRLELQTRSLRSRRRLTASTRSALPRPAADQISTASARSACSAVIAWRRRVVFPQHVAGARPRRQWRWSCRCGAGWSLLVEGQHRGSRRAARAPASRRCSRRRRHGRRRWPATADGGRRSRQRLRSLLNLLGPAATLSSRVRSSTQIRIWQRVREDAVVSSRRSVRCSKISFTSLAARCAAASRSARNCFATLHSTAAGLEVVVRSIRAPSEARLHAVSRDAAPIEPPARLEWRSWGMVDGAPLQRREQRRPPASPRARVHDDQQVAVDRCGCSRCRGVISPRTSDRAQPTLTQDQNSRG